MKKVLFGLSAIVIAVASVAFVKANPKVDAPLCPSGTFVYYYAGSSNTNIDIIKDVENWSLVAPDDQTECGDVVRICAICAYPNPNDSSLPLIDPSQATSGQVTHTTALENKLEDYAVNQTAGNDQQLQLFFEKF